MAKRSHKSNVCITDYIPLHRLQTVLDSAARQDRISLRLWSIAQAKKDNNNNGWLTPEWSNSCHYHTLIRSFPSGRELCLNYFKKTSQRILKQDHLTGCNEYCPTGLNIFGWPITDKEGSIIAILYGGLVGHKKQSILDNNDWQNLSSSLQKDGLLIKELENEFEHVRRMTCDERETLFNKWLLFCDALSSLLKRADELPDSSLWQRRLKNIHLCLSIAASLAKTQSGLANKTLVLHEKLPSNAVLSLKFSTTTKIECLSIDDKTYHNIQHSLPLDEDGTSALSLEENASNQETENFYYHAAKQLVPSLLRRDADVQTKLSRRWLERQFHIFDIVSEQSISDFPSTLTDIFKQLKKRGVADIDYAVFSEVRYFPAFDAQHKPKYPTSKPKLKVRATFPENLWTDKQKNTVEQLDLFSTAMEGRGNIVYAFQQKRTVLDRSTDKSPTFVELHSGVKSELALPVIYGSLVLGVIVFSSKKEESFNNGKKLLLEELTRLLAPIFYHDCFQTLSQELNRKILAEAAKHSKASISHKIRRLTLTTVCQLIQAEAASFWVKTENNTLKRDVSIGFKKNINDEISLEGSEISRLLHGDMDHILIEDLNNIPSNLLQGTIDIECLKSTGVSSYLAFRVRIASEKFFISFYRFSCNSARKRNFSAIELKMTRRLEEIFLFYESLNATFDNHKKELKQEIKNKKELAIRLAHSIKAPLSSASDRIHRLEYLINKEEVREDLVRKEFKEVRSDWSDIKESADAVLKHLCSQESYATGIFDIQAFHFYYDVIVKQISKVRKGLFIAKKTQRRHVNFTGHKKFPVLYADRSALNEVIGSLLENAVKYSRADDKITINSNYDYVSQTITITITNEGNIKILNDEYKKIFLYAYRSKDAVNKDPSSTGIGLYSSRSIIRSHGGEIKLLNHYQPVIFELTLQRDLLKKKAIAKKTLSKNTVNLKRKP